MNKNTANAQQFIGRVGNASTKPSARGVNLLGWGEAERLTPDQQRGALLAAVLNMQAKLEGASKAERKEIGQKICAMNLEIAALKPKPRFDGTALQQHILDIVKEKTPRLTWQRYVKEAQQRLEAAEAQQEASHV